MRTQRAANTLMVLIATSAVLSVWGTNSFRAAAALVPRIILLVYAAAFESLSQQADGLMGPRGIQPQRGPIDGEGGDRLDRFLAGPWRREQPGKLSGVLAFAAAAVAIFVPAGRFGGLVSAGALLWLRTVYGSFLTSGVDFLRFQWDVLLVEAGALAAACALATMPMSLPAQGFCSALAAHAMMLLGVKLMWGSCTCKLKSECPEWGSGTAMAHHHRTTCLPKPWGRAAHLWSNRKPWPSPWQGLATLIVEGPFCLLALSGLHYLRGLCALSWCGLMAGIVATGNYGFFNLLSCGIFFALLDDVQLEGLISPHLVVSAQQLPAHFSLLDLPLVAAFAAGWALYAAATVAVLCNSCDAKAPRWAQKVGWELSPWRLASSFGLFARMTTTRDEVVIRELHELPAAKARAAGKLVKAASDKGKDRYWVELCLPFKPGPLDRRPPFLLLHMPRLDWQFWFVSLAWGRGGCPPPWFKRFLELLKERRPEVVRLVSHKGQPAVQSHILKSPPLEVRVSLEDYEYRDPQSPQAPDPGWEQGRWWKRCHRQDYVDCPIV